MDMKKRFLAGMLSLVLCVSIALTGCGSNDSDKQASEENGVKTIKVWAMGEEGKLLPQMVEKFEANNPNIDVEVQALPWGQAHDKLLTAVASGNGPDIIQMGTSWIPEFADAGILKDLSEFTKDYPNISPDRYYVSSLATTEYDDKYVAVPWYVDTRVLYYRNDILSESGYPQGPSTWDELYDASKKLSARGEDKYGLSLDIRDQFFAVTFGWQNGSEIIKNGKSQFSEPEFVEAINYLKKFYDEKLTMMYGDVDIVQTFKDGTEPMFISGPWMVNVLNDAAPEISGKWSIRTLPAKKSNMSFVGGSNWTIFHNSKNVPEALKFIDYMSDTKTQIEWMKVSKALPARADAWVDPVIANDDYVSVFGEQLKNAKPSPFIVEWEEIAQELSASFERIIAENADVNAEMKKLDEKAKKVLEK
jgi:multiple sugar transport system substrate-binding protein